MKIHPSDQKGSERGGRMDGGPKRKIYGCTKVGNDSILASPFGKQSRQDREWSERVRKERRI